MLQMQSAAERYYNINKLYLMGMGLWPSQNKIIKILMPTIVCAAVFSIGILEFVRLLETWKDLSEACECFIIIMIAIGANVKLLTVVLNNRDMEQLFLLIDYHWCLFSHSEEAKILRDYAIIGRRITISYAAGIYVLTILYLLMPLMPQILDLVMPLNESRPYAFPFDIYYSFDRDEHFYAIVLHAHTVTVISVNMMITIDTLYIAYAQHGCSLFAAVGHQLENITSRLKEDSYLMRSKGNDFILVQSVHGQQENEIYQELVHCLRKHQLCIEYINQLDSLFAGSSFILLFMNVVVISLLGIEVIVLWDRKGEMMKYVSMSVGGFFHLFALNFPGERVLNHSSEIFRKAYNAKWYNLSRRTTQLLSIFFQRSIAPCTLTAGKFIVLSLANYASVVQTSMSYFTTLSSCR